MLPALVQAQLHRILQSTAFTNAPSLARFLQYLVDQFLEGKAEQVKQYTIGVAVFDRRDTFDPGTDTIVRVQARRLRARLRMYYESDGQDDPVVISVPKGRYHVVCEAATFPSYYSATNGVPDVEMPSGRPLVETPNRRPQRPTPLPAARTPLIGREEEMALVTQRLLSQEVRLLTITGAGGSGKTRLALRAGSELAPHFSGGVYFASLEALTDPSMLEATIAQLVDVRHTGGRRLAEVLQNYFRTAIHAPTLLLLDSFEHILPAAPLVAKLLDASPALKVLVTSRFVLHVYGEHEYALLPLPLPSLKCLAPFPELLLNPAIELFRQRAAAVNPSFAVTPENAAIVAEICCRLDGLPLAIELAAARIKMFSLTAMLLKFRSRLEFLTRGASDMPARQQTIRSAIDWSYELFSAEEQKLFRRLSVFRGGCTLEGTEAVCDTRRDLGIEVLAGITSLLDKSILREVHGKDGGVRFEMLDTIREYGLERLAESGETEFVKRSHAAFCLVLAEEGNPQLSPYERLEWLALCESEDDNLRAALEWMLATDSAAWAFRLGIALFSYWERKERLAEGRQWLEMILNMNSAQDGTKERARVILYAGNLATNQGDFEKAIIRYEDAFQIHRSLGDKRGAINQLNNIGINKGFQGDYASARIWFEQSLAACRELGDETETAAVLSNLANFANLQGDYALAHSLLKEAHSIFLKCQDFIGVGWCFSHLGDVARSQGNLAEAEQLYRDAANIFQKLGDKWGLARSLSDLGYVACDQGAAETADSAFAESLHRFQDLGHQRGVAKALEGFACLAAQKGDFERALTLAGAASTIRNSMGARPRPSEQCKLKCALDAAWQKMDHALAQAVWGAAQQMTTDAAIKYALRSPNPGAGILLEVSRIH